MFDYRKPKIENVRLSKIENRPCSIFQNRKSAMFDFPNRKSAMSEDRHRRQALVKQALVKSRKTGTRKTDSCIYFRKIIPGVIISCKRLQDFVFFELILWPNYNDVIDVIRNYRTDLISGSLKYRSHRTDLNSGSWGPEVPRNWKMPLKSKTGHVRRPKIENRPCTNRKSKIGHVRRAEIENRPCSIFQNRKSAMFDW